MPILTRFEKTRLIGARALQISMGAPPITKNVGNSPLETAKNELDEKILPLTVLRKYPNGKEIRIEIN